MREKEIIEGLIENNEISREDLVFLLKNEDEEVSRMMFEEARKIRERFFGNKIFMYGFVYF